MRRLSRRSAKREGGPTSYARFSRRLHYFSTEFAACLQEPNRGIERSRTQVHVTLRRGQVLMSREFLDGPRRRSTHRQMRAERVAQDMDACFHVRLPGPATHHHPNHFLREWLSFVVAKDACCPPMPRLPKRLG